MPQHPTARSAIYHPTTPLRLGMNALDRSSHLCFLYRTREECAEIAKAFVEVGVARREKCLCVVQKGLETSFSESLRTPGTGVGRTSGAAGVEVTTMERAGFAAGGRASFHTLDFWREGVRGARSEGYSRLRGLIQVDRPLADVAARARWIDYENGLTQVFERWGGTILCLYKRTAHPADFVRDALCAHAFVAHQGVIARNAFYVPPQEHRARDRARRETDRILSSVVRVAVTERDEVGKNSQQLCRYCDYLTAAEEIAQMGTWAWNSTTGELFWSRQHFQLFGLDPARDRVCYARFFASVHPEDRADIELKFQEAVRLGKDFDGEYRIVLRNGSVRCIHSRANPIFGKSNDLTEYVGTVSDVTERRKHEESLGHMQAQLAQSSQAAALHQLIAAIAHEVNQPLAAVITNAGAVRRWLAGARPLVDKARRGLDSIVSDGNRASEVIARVRGLIRSTDARHSSLSLNSSIREVLAFVRTELQRNRIVVRMNLANDLPPVSADQVQIQQVLINLITNAIEAMSTIVKRPRLLTIATVADICGAVCSVTDSGVGLSRRSVERVFQPFYTTKPRGMGIGLAISRTIIEAHGGHLRAEGKRGRGATFRFNVPFGRARMG